MFADRRLAISGSSLPALIGKPLSGFTKLAFTFGVIISAAVK
jgi:hypothetical protein